MAEATMIPLPDAAFRLALTWSQAYRLVLNRELPAEKRGARWYVQEEAVARQETEPAA